MRKILIIISVLMVTLLSGQWDQQTSGVGDNLYATYFLDVDNGYSVGWGASSGGVVLKTTNGGTDWQSTTLSSNSYLFSVTFTDADNGYIAGCLNGGSAGAIFRTTDGGGNWTSSSFSNTWGLYDVEFATPQLGYACGWMGKIYKTTDGGDNWSGLTSGTSSVLRWMSVVNADTGYIVGGSNWNATNQLYKMVDGNTWSHVYDFGSTVISGIHFFDENTGIVGGGNGSEQILKTTDGGESWQVKHTQPGGLLQSIYFEEDGTGWACGNNGRVITTTDFGETWEAVPSTSPAPTLLGIHGAEGLVVTTGTNGYIFKKISGESIVADFFANQLSGTAPATISFSSACIGDVTNWDWDFNNDGVIDATTEHVNWTFTEAGEFTVSLRAYNDETTDTRIREDYITINPTSNDNHDILKDKLNMYNYPNPFRYAESERGSGTTIQFSAPLTKDSVVKIFNVKGQLVRSLTVAAKANSIFWNGKDERDLVASAGVYLYKIEIEQGISLAKKMVLVK